MKEWEYLVVTRQVRTNKKTYEKYIEYTARRKKYKSAQDMLDYLGPRGWELVGVAPNLTGTSTQNKYGHYYFKRPYSIAHADDYNSEP